MRGLKGFAGRLDRFLLLNCPILWIIRVQHVVFGGVAASLALTAVAYFMPVRTDRVPNIILYTLILFAASGIVSIYWYYLQARDFSRIPHTRKVAGFNTLITLGYFLCLTLINTPPYLFSALLAHRISSLVDIRTLNNDRNVIFEIKTYAREKRNSCTENSLNDFIYKSDVINRYFTQQRLRDTRKKDLASLNDDVNKLPIGEWRSLNIWYKVFIESIGDEELETVEQIFPEFDKRISCKQRLQLSNREKAMTGREKMQALAAFDKITDVELDELGLRRGPAAYAPDPSRSYNEYAPDENEQKIHKEGNRTPRCEMDKLPSDCTEKSLPYLCERESFLVRSYGQRVFAEMFYASKNTENDVIYRTKLSLLFFNMIKADVCSNNNVFLATFKKPKDYAMKIVRKYTSDKSITFSAVVNILASRRAFEQSEFGSNIEKIDVAHNFADMYFQEANFYSMILIIIFAASISLLLLTIAQKRVFLISIGVLIVIVILESIVFSLLPSIPEIDTGKIFTCTNLILFCMCLLLSLTVFGIKKFRLIPAISLTLVSLTAPFMSLFIGGPKDYLLTYYLLAGVSFYLLLSLFLESIFDRLYSLPE